MKKQYKLNVLLSLFSIYCIALVFFRAWFTGSIFYMFLIWNLILAYVPLSISQLMLSKNHKKSSTVALAAIWLLFLPNAPYIITDFIHIKQGTLMPLWFDLLLVFSFAFNGIILFFISVEDVQFLISKHFSSFKTWTITVFILFLTGFGVYLGRFLRFNSWELASNPKRLFVEIFDRVLQPTSHPRTWGFTIGFGTLLLLGFLIFRAINTKDAVKIS